MCHATSVLAVTSSGLRAVALSNDPAPGTPIGTIFRDLGYSHINAQGEVAFRSSLGGPTISEQNNWGTWSEGHGGMHLVARENQVAPGSGGKRFTDNLPIPIINSTGDSFFWALLGDEPQSGIWVDRSGATQLVVIDGAAAPGSAAGVTFSSQSIYSGFAMNDAGAVAFMAQLTGPGVTFANRHGLWVGAPGSFRLVARSGQQAPGLDPDVTIASMNSDQFSRTPGLTPSGKVLLGTNLSGPGVTGANNQAIWVDDNGSMTLAIRSGVQPPNGLPGSFLHDFHHRDAVINDAGDVALLASVFGTGADDTNRFGIWSKRDGSFDEVARMGSQAPGMAPGTVYSSISEPVINQAGDVAFTAAITPQSGSPRDAIWAEHDRQVQLIAQGGDPAPGAGVGVTFSGFGRFNFNDLGQIAFYAITSNGRNGVWATDVAGDLHKIVIENELIEVRPGDFRTVTDIPNDSFVDFRGNETGRGFALNELGALVFRAEVNGDDGIFVSTVVAVPEPSTTALTLAFCLALLRLHRRC
jgi:hypothetical protein